MHDFRRNGGAPGPDHFSSLVNKTVVNHTKLPASRRRLDGGNAAVNGYVAVSASAGRDGDDVSNKDKEYVRRRLGEVMGTINELLDELRCDLADECAEDDDA